MKLFHPLAAFRLLAFSTLISLSLPPISAQCEIKAGSYDIAAVRDQSTLETRVVEDWHPWAKDADVKQKLVEVTICEWWPGQKVRLPVTFVVPAKGGACKNVIVANTGLPLKAAAPTGSMLRLLKEHGVGLVYIGMNTIDSMEPAPLLMSGMKEHFLKSKDARYTPAWIWGMSDMRALTAAMAEKDVFQPTKVIATGGSKRGVATAAAGIADDRFTGIMPVVAPIIDSPGGPYVEGTRAADIVKENEKFLVDLVAGKIPNAPVTARDPLVARDKIRADERVSLQQARDAGWSDAEIKAASSLAWEVCRTTNFLPALQKRGLEIFYNQGTNDNVTPGMLELGRRFPDFPAYIIPGGQHGGAKETGFMKQVGGLPDVEENLFAFAQHDFFNARPMVATPKITTQWDAAKLTLRVTAKFPDNVEPQKNDSWWSINRHRDYTFAMEYDAWQSVPMKKTGAATFSGEITLKEQPKTVDLVTVHQHTAGGSTLTMSSPLVRAVGGK